VLLTKGVVVEFFLSAISHRFMFACPKSGGYQLSSSNDANNMLAF
jgi:hypothetical protein